MASGDTLVVFLPFDNEPPASNPAQIGFRNGHPVLKFDQTTGEFAVFSAVMPRHFTPGGITVYLHWSTTVTSGTVSWTVELERVGDSQQDVDADGFDAAQVVGPTTVPGTSGHVDIVNTSFAGGGDVDDIAPGELFRVRIGRDISDTAAADAELHAVELRE